MVILLLWNLIEHCVAIYSIAVMQKNRKMLCVTSATTGEGVSEVAANLAISLSKNNDKVLLIMVITQSSCNMLYLM